MRITVVRYRPFFQLLLLAAQLRARGTRRHSNRAPRAPPRVPGAHTPGTIERLTSVRPRVAVSAATTGAANVAQADQRKIHSWGAGFEAEAAAQHAPLGCAGANERRDEAVHKSARRPQERYVQKD